jgi:hypothetical protein
MASRTTARPSVRTTKLSASISIARNTVADNANVISAKAKADDARKALNAATAQAVAEQQAAIFKQVANIDINTVISGEMLLLEITAFELLEQKWRVLPDNEATADKHKVEVARLKRDYGINPDKFVAGDPLARWENTYDGYRLDGDLARAAVKHGERSFEDVTEFHKSIVDALASKKSTLKLLLETE